jgi:hypothetical protein
VKTALFILTLASFLFAAQDSIYTRADTLHWNKVVTGASWNRHGDLTFEVDPSVLPYILPDTLNGILFNASGADLRWKREDQGADSALIDTLRLHLKKEIKRRRK